MIKSDALTCGLRFFHRLIKKLEHTWKALVHDGVSLDSSITDTAAMRHKHICMLMLLLRFYFFFYINHFSALKKKQAAGPRRLKIKDISSQCIMSCGEQQQIKDR